MRQPFSGCVSLCVRASLRTSETVRACVGRGGRGFEDKRIRDSHERGSEETSVMLRTVRAMPGVEVRGWHGGAEAGNSAHTERRGNSAHIERRGMQESPEREPRETPRAMPHSHHTHTHTTVWRQRGRTAVRDGAEREAGRCKREAGWRREGGTRTTPATRHPSPTRIIII
jgi:hypothetical protein